MKQKPLVCLVDEDPFVREGWVRSLRADAVVDYHRDHLSLLRKVATNASLLPRYSCVIFGRYFNHLGLDILTSEIPELLKKNGIRPVFLNWQGYVSKDELNRKFDGKLFHKYGVRWQTMRLRIQKFEQKQCSVRKPIEIIEQVIEPLPLQNLPSRPERCSALLRSMADNAAGQHRERIEFYANHDQETGIQLLEAIYNRLVTDKNRPATCPSRYINSSPVIAKRILREALFS